ncbi:MAG: hypothetical protein FWC53_01185 [Firmicutes bacterium]|nr:hypothetical protein [Bacillota bacterium]
MIDVTKDELLRARIPHKRLQGVAPLNKGDKSSSKWRSKKSRWTFYAETIMKHKIITVMVLCFGICMVTNVLLIYSFVTILSNVGM